MACLLIVERNSLQHVCEAEGKFPHTFSVYDFEHVLISVFEQAMTFKNVKQATTAKQ